MGASDLRTAFAVSDFAFGEPDAAAGAFYWVFDADWGDYGAAAGGDFQGMSAEWNGMADCRGACTYSFACGGTGKAVRQAAEKKMKKIVIIFTYRACVGSLNSV